MPHNICVALSLSECKCWGNSSETLADRPWASPLGPKWEAMNLTYKLVTNRPEGVLSLTTTVEIGRLSIFPHTWIMQRMDEEVTKKQDPWYIHIILLYIYIHIYILHISYYYIYIPMYIYTYTLDGMIN